MWIYSKYYEFFLELDQSKNRKGIKYKFGWLNSSTQNAIMTSFGLNKGNEPKLVFINTGSRKRFYFYDGGITEKI